MGMYPSGVSKEAGRVNASARLPRKLRLSRLRCRLMFARNPSASVSHWGRTCLLSALLGLPLFASCTGSEDTEPFVPAVEGARQPQGSGALVSEDDACERLLKAAEAAYERLDCSSPTFPDCPGFLRPGGGSGCYEYFDDSVSACEQTYDQAASCRELSPCLATAQLNEDLPTCERVGVIEPVGGAGGAAGAGAVAGAGTGGMPEGGSATVPEAGAAGASGSGGAAGQSAGGAG
jgi:hypothetical protein